MPYKSEKIKLPPEKDRRRKLTDDQKEQIKSIYAEGSVGTRSLAKQFGVSRKTIRTKIISIIFRSKDTTMPIRPKKSSIRATSKCSKASKTFLT